MINFNKIYTNPNLIVVSFLHCHVRFHMTNHKIPFLVAYNSSQKFFLLAKLKLNEVALFTKTGERLLIIIADCAFN